MTISNSRIKERCAKCGGTVFEVIRETGAYPFCDVNYHFICAKCRYSGFAEEGFYIGKLHIKEEEEHEENG